MQSVHELETPAVLVDLEVLDRNISRMAGRARALSVRLRPHTKTHKIPEIARMQLDAGASGLTVAKPDEAEVFALAGFADLFIAYPVVGIGKARKLLSLAERVRLAVGVDSLEGAEALSREFEAANRRLSVLLKVDTGYNRVGVPPERAKEVASRITGMKGLHFRGVFTHAGHAYAAASQGEVAAIGRSEGKDLAEVAQDLRDAGIPVEEVSVGSTPTVAHAMAKGVSECRPGNYVFHDASQVALGSATLADCALTVLSTVVSVSAGRAVVDAGSKTLSSDPLRPRADGHGMIYGKKSRLQRLSEEHGVIPVDAEDTFRIGERIRILPNHACVVSNLHDRLYGVRGSYVETEFRVAARGCVR